MFSRCLIAALIAGLPYSVASACDFCLVSQGISPLQTLNGVGLWVNQRYTLLDQVYQGDREITNPGVRERFWTTELSGFYGVNDRLLLIATLPARKTDGQGDVSTGAKGEVDTARGGDGGVGDRALMGRYTIFSHHTLTSSLSDLGNRRDAAIGMGTHPTSIARQRREYFGGGAAARHASPISTTRTGAASER